MKKKYKYVQLMTRDPVICDRMNNILIGRRRKKELLLKYLDLGLNEALKDIPKEENGSKYICSIPLRYDNPREAELIALKDKLGYHSSEVFINAILIGFKKTSPMEVKI